LFRRALISVEPLYKLYFQRLGELFRESYRQDQEADYKLNVANYLDAKAAYEFGINDWSETDINPLEIDF
jgi:hypothetical protein